MRPLLIGPVDIRAGSANYAFVNDLTRQEVDAKLCAIKSEVDARLANFDASIQTGFSAIRSDFAHMRTDLSNMRTDTANMRADMVRQIHASIFKAVGVMVAVVSIGFAVIGLMINWNKGERSSAPSAPIIITVPAAPQAPATVLTPSPPHGQ